MAGCFGCFHSYVCDGDRHETARWKGSCPDFLNTTDVALVVHGRWAEQLDGTHYCSECGHDAAYTYDGTEIRGVACPFCGAIMDKER